MDPDCPALMSCLDGECVDPCRKNSPCQGDEECSVVESAGKTTVVCACPAGTITGSNGRCRDPIQQTFIDQLTSRFQILVELILS